ncbi:hypothetical protein HA402_010923 [Bradysia odoriphaga]|nr:hypothetical protein HA402_010923 [Bradysia odoriphaga]
MPHDLFEPSDDTVSPMLNSDINVASGSYNASLSDDYSKKVMPTSSKNLAIAKYNNKQDSEDIQLNTPEDVNMQLENIQGDLDSLKELFQADADYSLDANALFGIFGDLDAPFGLSLNPDFPMDKRDDAGTSGSELINYQPYNSLDLSEIMDPDSALAGIEDKQNENADDDSLLNAPELNTPRIDNKTISFNTKQ